MENKKMNILVFVADMPYARPALIFGRLIARLTQSPVTLLHVNPHQSNLTRGAGILARAHEMLPDVVINTQIRQDTPTSGILEEIHTGKYDLVVLRARRKLWLTQRFRGVVGRMIAKHAPVSVLIVKRDSPDLKRILVCTGGVDIAETAIKAGAQLAQAAHARATLLYVTNPLPSMYTGLNGIEETLPELLQTNTPVARHLRHAAEILAQHQVSAELELRRGVVSNEILREADRGNYDLIIVGASRVANGLKGWVLGDVTWQVVNEARCPVLVVR
ncbi:MAG: universal stress protein [Anaerolineales bacterium]